MKKTLFLVSIVLCYTFFVSNAFGQIKVTFFYEKVPGLQAKTILNQPTELYIAYSKDTSFVVQSGRHEFTILRSDINRIIKSKEVFFKLVGCGYEAVIPIEKQDIENSSFLKIKLSVTENGTSAHVEYCRQECVNVFYPEIPVVGRLLE
jgi:hypothetical protein